MKYQSQETRPSLWQIVLAVIMTLCIFLFGCKKQALETTSDGDFEIEFLFEKDGVRMYRFEDDGKTVYFWSDQPKQEEWIKWGYQIEGDTLNLEQWR